MAAPQIPNLLSLRGSSTSRRAGLSRGRGRGTLSTSTSSSSVAPTKATATHILSDGRRIPQSDLDVQATDTDAAVSRLSVVDLGYLQDEFAECFVGLGRRVRRMPVINRGTYCRTTAIDRLVDHFLESSPPVHDSTSEPKRQKKQIISLGAGTDTRYFRLRKAGKTNDLIYHEFDFPDVARLKHVTVRKNASLQDDNEELFEEEVDGETRWGFKSRPTTPTGPTKGQRASDHVKYGFHPLDLRSLPSTPLSSIIALETDIPTLLISECCLCYLPTQTTSQIIQHFQSSIENLGIILYEPIGPNDAFGQMMKQNLKARGLSMPTVAAFEDLDAQRGRMRSAGFGSGWDAIDIECVWERWVVGSEKERVDALEGLDEVEEWLVLARHYAVVWGWKGMGFGGWNGVR